MRENAKGSREKDGSEIESGTGTSPRNFQKSAGIVSPPAL